MKISHAIGLVTVSVLITVVIEESRISSMRESVTPGLTATAVNTPASIAAASADDSDAPVKTKSRSELATANPAKKPATKWPKR